MSPEQLSQLQRLTDLFNQGRAGVTQVKELSDLLALINQQQDEPYDSINMSASAHLAELESS